MSEYGYIPESPAQSFRNNKGIFTPNDIYDLTRADKFTNLGQLELIQTQTASSSSVDFTSVNFESIKESEYNVHFLTFSEGRSNGYQYLSLRFGNNTSYTASGYRYGNQSMLNATFSEQKSNSDNTIRIGSYVYKGENAYAYIYNIGDDSKFTFVTSHMVGVEGNNSACASSYGMGAYTSAESFNNIQILRTNSVGWYSYKASLYGIKEYS